ncbi:MAG TPA: allantoinase AllB [Candidatus Acidoferrum sp.]|nr:allantoinase AllB [Candidatus Acidoferrum sp.]
MIVRGGTIITERGIERADIAIEAGTITEIGADLGEQREEIDATGLHVFPGGIDSHVHFNEPGRTGWEDVAHGTAALAAGGYTCFVDMPLNNLPVTTTAEAFDLKLAAMRRSARVDFGLWGGLVPGNLEQLAPMVERGAMGFKAFMCPSGIDEFPASDEKTLREGMKRIAELDSILLVHAENPGLLREPKGPTPDDFIHSRPPEAEVSAIELCVEMSGDTGCRVHVVHVSTAAGAALLRGAVSGETCPHYLLYTSDDLAQLGGLGKCAPPLRGERMQLMPIIVSDHSPSTLGLKQAGDFRNIWGGISGCQSTRQLLLATDLEPSTIAAVTSTNVARRFRIAGKGDVAAGFDADLWLVDLGWEGAVRRTDLLYKNPFSAHEGHKIRGRTVRTIHGAPKFIRPGAR